MRGAGAQRATVGGPGRGGRCLHLFTLNRGSRSTFYSNAPFFSLLETKQSPCCAEGCSTLSSTYSSPENLFKGTSRTHPLRYLHLCLVDSGESYELLWKPMPRRRSVFLFPQACSYRWGWPAQGVEVDLGARKCSHGSGWGQQSCGAAQAVSPPKPGVWRMEARTYGRLTFNPDRHQGTLTPLMVGPANSEWV